MWPQKGVWCASGASAKTFGKNFIKQKLQGTPNLGGGGRSPFLDPKGSVTHFLLEQRSLILKEGV